METQEDITTPQKFDVESIITAIVNKAQHHGPKSIPNAGALHVYYHDHHRPSRLDLANLRSRLVVKISVFED